MDFNELFTKDKPVIFAFHAYPWLIHRLTYRRTNHDNIHVRGYKEEDQSPELASARLNGMNVRFKVRLPWALAFSFARALQQPALEIWRGDDAHVLAAQQARLHRARCNRSARRGEYSAAMESVCT
jgi:hypothetical protein